MCPIISHVNVVGISEMSVIVVIVVVVILVVDIVVVVAVVVVCCSCCCCCCCCWPVWSGLVTSVFRSAMTCRCISTAGFGSQARFFIASIRPSIFVVVVDLNSGLIVILHLFDLQVHVLLMLYTCVLLHLWFQQLLLFNVTRIPPRLRSTCNICFLLCG